MTTTSAFDLFKIGIGPSSSHTVGPMTAARRFALDLRARGLFERTARVRVELYGSLGATGRGHGTDRAVVLGLEGAEPDTVDPADMAERVTAIFDAGRLHLLGRQPVAVDRDHLTFRGEVTLPFHPNGMRFVALDHEGALLHARVSYSVGGGALVEEGEHGPEPVALSRGEPPHPFWSAAELLELCATTGGRISDLVAANEHTWRSPAEVRAGLLRIWAVMADSIRRGTMTEGELPGGLGVRRRAPALARTLRSEAHAADPLLSMDELDVWALAVSEENAAGGRVVTAPTNGAAGIIPAVLMHYHRVVPGADDGGTVRFLLAATAVGALCKENASISGAEVGCQGEVGSACSMAAAGLAEVLGGTPAQVENAAEIAMEHNLGLTCDPIGGLVQVPCIERNAMAAVKAVNAARMALLGDGRHLVSFDSVIRTMLETGADMKTKYKETARGGLAVNVPEC